MKDKMHWIELKNEKPPKGILVEVLTIYGFEDVGIWNGKFFENNKGQLVGYKSEVSKWKIKQSN